MEVLTAFRRAQDPLHLAYDRSIRVIHEERCSKMLSTALDFVEDKKSVKFPLFNNNRPGIVEKV